MGFGGVDSNGKQYIQHGWRSTIQDARDGFNFILKTICGEKTKIGLYVRYMGAPLALSLALNSKSQPLKREFSTVALGNETLDWTDLVWMTKIANNDLICRHNDINALLAFCRLVRHLNSQFKSPPDCFDPFPSPVFYFRSSDREVPNNLPPHDLESHPSRSYRIEYFEPIPRQRRKFLSVSMETLSFTYLQYVLTLNRNQCMHNPLLKWQIFSGQ